jgi:hypothetical protein
MANSTVQNKKVISLALGAVADGAYLYAGADRAIAAEMQGKDNGDIIYYKTTNLGQAEISDVSMGVTPNSGLANLDIASATPVKHRQVPVKIKDARVMYNVKAVEKQITSLGKDIAMGKIGQKLAKKAVKNVIAEDILTIGNIFVGNDFAAFQKAGAFLKAYVDGTLYGFMDWNVWGDLTAKGQQAVPCALAEPRFGRNLRGSWSLIDQLRTIPDIPQFTIGDVASAKVKASVATSATTATITITAGSSALAVGDKVVLAVPGINALDVNDNDTGVANSFVVTLASSVAAAGTLDVTVTWDLDLVVIPAAVAANAAVTVKGTAGTYGATIIRAEGAQAFGTMNQCDCEGAKYEKSSIDGLTVHANSGENIGSLSTDSRYDMILCSKLVEPRAAALVLYKIA